MKSTAEQLWQEIITTDWNLAVVQARQQDPATFYPGKPVLLSAQEIFALRLFDFSDAHLSTPVAGQNLTLDPRKFYSLVDSTHAKLQENLTDDAGPVGQYLRAEFARYDSLVDKRQYGFYAFYFTRTGELEAIVQFPELPTYKLALCCSTSQLLQDEHYRRPWLENRQLFNRTHVLVAGASVASVTAENLIRDGRLGYLTIGDPKGPNATNLNRTAYDVLDIASGEPKAIGFARHIHRQDPTQILYLCPEGFNAQNLSNYCFHPDRPRVDLVVEAIDSLQQKLEILQVIPQLQLPMVQISDVGSKAQLTFKNFDDAAQGQSMVFGLADDKLQALLKEDFIQVAAYFVGLENSLDDEIGKFIQGDKNTPFGNVTPQMGSTAAVAAGLASEKILRFLLDRGQQPYFAHRQIVIDKKHNTFKEFDEPSLKARLLGLMMDYKRTHKKLAATS